MRNLSIPLMSLILGLAIEAVAGPTDPIEASEVTARKELSQILREAQTVGEFFELIKKGISTENLAFLKTKVTGGEKSKLQVVEAADGSFRITVGQALVPFKIDGQSDNKVLMTINNKRVTYDPTQSIEIFWKEVTNSMPQNASLDRITILPKAHAAIPFVIAAAAVAAGAGTFFYSVMNCTTYGIYGGLCKSGNISHELILKAARLDSSRWNISIGCNDKKEELRACLKKEVKAKRIKIPKELTSYFDQQHSQVQPQRTSK